MAICAIYCLILYFRQAILKSTSAWGCHRKKEKGQLSSPALRAHCQSIVLVRRLFCNRNFTNCLCVSPSELFRRSQANYQHMQGVSFRRENINFSTLWLLQFHTIFDSRNHAPISVFWLKMEVQVPYSAAVSFCSERPLGCVLAAPTKVLAGPLAYSTTSPASPSPTQAVCSHCLRLAGTVIWCSFDISMFRTGSNRLFSFGSSLSCVNLPCMCPRTVYSGWRSCEECEMTLNLCISCLYNRHPSFYLYAEL